MEEKMPLLPPEGEPRPRGKKLARNIALAFVFVGIVLGLGWIIFARRSPAHSGGRTHHLLYVGNGLDVVAQTIKEGGKEEELVRDCLYGKSKLQERHRLEDELKIKGIRLTDRSPAHFHQLFLKSSPRARQIGECAVVAENAQKKLKDRDAASETKYGCVPKKSVECDRRSVYRRIDGRCNNLRNPLWGGSYAAFRRLLEPNYGDGVSTPRRSRSGGVLPSARLVSNSLYTEKPRVDSECTLMTMLWGLFVDHDLTNTAVGQDKDGSSITCCHDQVRRDETYSHPECLPIEIPRDDPFFGQFNVTCMEFVRSSPVKTPRSAHRQQLNQITSFLDASAVYGSSRQEETSLRAYRGGRLKVGNIHHTQVLPKNYDRDSFCGLPREQLFCFLAGDRRANEHVELTVVHTLWVREHNRLAALLQEANPKWEDEKLFQEARKIVVAELQHVTYNEYLPLLFGEENLDRLGLRLQSSGYYGGYDASSDATASNVFAAAAFRFGHSQVQSVIELYSSNGDRKRLQLHETFFNPSVFYLEGLDTVVRGATKQRSKVVWSQISDEVRNKLFQSHLSYYGLDLSSISIQRGRDHGIPSYVQWRRYCNLTEISTWEQLASALDHKNARILKNIYENVDDVDLIPAALSETKSGAGAILGPTHSCLVAEQFAATRNGDRFWYENPGVFSPDQLRQIRKASLSRILCDNSDHLLSIQKRPLYPQSPSNPVVHCANSTDVPELSVGPWSS